MAEILAIIMVLTIFVVLISGYPVAFILAGISLLFALIGTGLDVFSLHTLNALPARIYGIMTNDLLIAVPLFVFMGVTLERAKIAEELLETMAGLFGGVRGGLGISVLLVGALLAASTGIVGATVVTMGLISLPTMLKTGYCPRISAGTICAAGTLGQIIPPSIVLILLGDQISNAWQTAQLKDGIASPIPVTIADLFIAAVIPGLLLVLLYMVWQIFYGMRYPERVPPLPKEERNKLFDKGKWTQVLNVLLPPLLLIFIVLGSILAGLATATESAAVGAVGALLLAIKRRQLTKENLNTIVRSTTQITSMVFTILIGATIFSLVFRGLGGDDMIHEHLSNLPGGLLGAMLIVMLVVFLLGFFLDFIEIIFIVVPIVAPILLAMGAHPIWLAMMMAINLQTSFLTPPFGFSLFYLRGVAPKTVATADIYRGAIPFVIIQIGMLLCLTLSPELATWLPETIYNNTFPVLGEGQGTAIIDPVNPAQPQSYDIDF